MSDAIQPNAVNGLSTAYNATISNTSVAVAITGKVMKMSVHSQRLAYRYGGPGDTVTGSTTGNGFRLPAGAVIRETVPPKATHVHLIRVDGTDAEVSIEFGPGGI